MRWTVDRIAGTETPPDCSWGLLLAGLVLSAAFAWVVLAHPTAAERQRTVDASCPPVKMVRRPEGVVPAVCQPTGQAWR